MASQVESVADDLNDNEEDDFQLPRKQRDDDEMDITPMIDITFLLLIFFVVCSKMDPTQMGAIPEAQNGVAVSAKNSAVIFIEPLGNDKVVLKRSDGSEFSRDEELQISEIIEYVRKETTSTGWRTKRRRHDHGRCRSRCGGGHARAENHW